MELRLENTSLGSFTDTRSVISSVCFIFDREGDFITYTDWIKRLNDFEIGSRPEKE
jgi:hypothetical protein